MLMTTAFTRDMQWKVDFLYDTNAWHEVVDEHHSCDNRIRLSHKHISSLQILGETVDDKSLWMFNTLSLDEIVIAVEVSEIVRLQPSCAHVESPM